MSYQTLWESRGAGRRFVAFPSVWVLCYRVGVALLALADREPHPQRLPAALERSPPRQHGSTTAAPAPELSFPRPGRSLTSSKSLRSQLPLAGIISFQAPGELSIPCRIRVFLVFLDLSVTFPIIRVQSGSSVRLLVTRDSATHPLAGTDTVRVWASSREGRHLRQRSRRQQRGEPEEVRGSRCLPGAHVAVAMGSEVGAFPLPHVFPYLGLQDRVRLSQVMRFLPRATKLCRDRLVAAFGVP